MSNNVGITIRQTGGPEVMEYTELPEPEVGPSTVVVDIAAAGVNFIDTYHRAGLYPMEFPLTPGLEGAGTITGVGADVDGFAVGDRVAWSESIGSYAVRTSADPDKLVHVPDGVPLETAAAVMLQGLTAHYLATDTFPLGTDHRALVHAGAGGVGLLLTQIAKLKGAEVFATVGSAEKAELSRAAGADHVIEYRSVDFADAIADIAGPRPIDVVYDGVGRTTFEKGISVLKPRGMMVTFGNASGPVDPVSPLELMRNGSLFLTRPTLFDYVATSAEFRSRASDLFEWIENGDLDVRVGATYPMSEAAAAHIALESRRTTGKVLLVP
jgi:NADPH2:quinone reductase